MRATAKQRTAPILKALADPVLAMMMPHALRAALADLCAFVIELAGEVDKLKGNNDGS